MVSWAVARLFRTSMCRWQGLARHASASMALRPTTAGSALGLVFASTANSAPAANSAAEEASVSMVSDATSASSAVTLLSFNLCTPIHLHHCLQCPCSKQFFILLVVRVCKHTQFFGFLAVPGPSLVTAVGAVAADAVSSVMHRNEQIVGEAVNCVGSGSGSECRYLRFLLS